MNDAPPPRVIAEYRRKRKGEPGSWHFLVRKCCFCGASHSHDAPGIQQSRCMDRGRLSYDVITETLEEV
jgi:hypothetical protein